MALSLHSKGKSEFSALLFAHLSLSCLSAGLEQTGPINWGLQLELR
jgi:hypothetical protein